MVQAKLVGEALGLRLVLGAARLPARPAPVVAEADVPLLGALVDVRHDRVLSVSEYPLG
jgi:hypothetical protein